MYEINLIRSKAILPKTQRKVFRILVGSAVLFGLLLLIQIFRTIGLSVKISKMRDQKNTIGITINNMINEYSIEQWGEEWVGFYNDMSLVSKIYKEKTYWAIRLKKFMDLLPPNMTVDKITVGKQGKSLVVILFALVEQAEGDYEPIKRFIDILEHSALFSKGVRLESQQRSEIEKKTVHIIEISVPVKED
jgi:Tfp pilus assembly protein PilN